MIGSEGVTQPTREIVIENNTFRNDGDYPTIFVDRPDRHGSETRWQQDLRQRPGHAAEG